MKEYRVFGSENLLNPHQPDDGNKPKTDLPDISACLNKIDELEARGTQLEAINKAMLYDSVAFASCVAPITLTSQKTFDLTTLLKIYKAKHGTLTAGKKMIPCPETRCDFPFDPFDIYLNSCLLYTSPSPRD